MSKRIYVYARKIHFFIALPMLLLIISNVLSQGSSINRIIFPVTVVTMAILAITGSYMWFWLYLLRRKEGYKDRR